MTHAKLPAVGDKVNFVGRFKTEDGVIVYVEPSVSWLVTIDKGDGRFEVNVPYNEAERPVINTWNYA